MINAIRHNEAREWENVNDGNGPKFKKQTSNGAISEIQWHVT